MCFLFQYAFFLCDFFGGLFLNKLFFYKCVSKKKWCFLGKMSFFGKQVVLCNRCFSISLFSQWVVFQCKCYRCFFIGCFQNSYF